jgi:glycosyltransferase involved in cell wall biosynthesis
MPNVVLEAMASGLPVVATRAEGIVELLGSDEPPQIIDFGDSDALVASLSTLLENPPQSRNLGSANRLRAASQFSLATMVNRYRNLYENLLGFR